MIEHVKNSGSFSSVIVSTEDKETSQIAKKFGAEVPFMRPKNLATDTTPMDKVLLHAVKELHNLGYEFDIFVLRDATTPFISSTDIKKSIQLLKKRKVPIVCAVYEQHLNPYFNIVEKDSKGFLKLSKKLKTRPKSRQQAPKVYQLNGLYTYDTKKFLKIKKTDFSKSIPLEIPIESGLMIDTPFEFLITKSLLENNEVNLK